MILGNINKMYVVFGIRLMISMLVIYLVMFMTWTLLTKDTDKCETFDDNFTLFTYDIEIFLLHILIEMEVVGSN